MTMIRRLLIANRGEIARRIMRTCREMGIATVAVYSDADEDAVFVREADLAVAIGGTASRESYLDIEKLIAAARRAEAAAVHPGYGFLAESAAFARACGEAGLTWVGPGPEAIAAMGDKLAAKNLVAAAGVPVLRDFDVAGRGDEEVERLAAELGYPVLVKAAAGGGGRGMRVVDNPGALGDALAGARREAAAAFGDDRIFLERLLTDVRHVEIQVIGDHHGHLVHCFERDCSVQRRHQKVVEEAPSPAVDPDLRERMGSAAVSAARAVGYTNAGTVEFLLDADRRFYFLEMNTRLQVEHPVTEEITGRDLVRDQIRVAMGEPLGFSQDDLTVSGHAIEVRLYAEDPAHDFMPGAGPVHVFAPPESPAVRFESAVESGSVVSIHYDPMLAKVIAHAPTRDEAALRLAAALERTRIHGLTTNRDFLVATLRHPAFLAGDVTTSFIDRHGHELRRIPSTTELATAALAAALHAAETRPVQGMPPGIPRGWRNNPAVAQAVTFRHRGEDIAVSFQAGRDGTYACRVGGDEHVAWVSETGPDTIALVVDGVRTSHSLHRHGDTVYVHVRPGPEVVLTEAPRFPEPERQAVAGGYTAPMPGKVVAIAVTPGARVRRGDLLVVMEAMKMEHRITAHTDGEVAAVPVVEGDQVDMGQALVLMTETPEPA